MADKSGNTYTIAKMAAWHIKNKASEMFDDACVMAWVADIARSKGITEAEARQKVGMLAMEKITDWMLGIVRNRKKYTYARTPAQIENFLKMREALEKARKTRKKAKEKVAENELKLE